MWYHVSSANSYLVITGGGVKDVKLAKKAWIMPWQKFDRLLITPFDFEITLQAMTIEKLQLLLPAVFTIGPEDTPDALAKYAKILTGGVMTPKAGTTPSGRSHVQDIVKGIIEGETRVIVSGMSMEEIFKERQVFKERVTKNVQAELDQFGLKIYNANVKELQDTPGSEYFMFLSRKAHEGASNQAKVDVANARMMGEIGEAEKQGQTRQELSKISAQTAILETERKKEKAEADAELTLTKTRIDAEVNLAQIEAARNNEAKDADKQREVESKKAAMNLEKRRATDVVNARIDAEASQQKADARLYSENKTSDGVAYNRRAEAEAKQYAESKDADTLVYKRKTEAETHLFAQKQAADADMYREKQTIEANYLRATKEAEASFVAQQKKAQGLTEMAKAYSHMAGAFGGPQGLLQYMMLENNTYEKLAKQNAAAVQGLQPKITVWNTGDQGAGGSNGGDAMSGTIRNLFQSLPPLLSTINEQTGIQPPGWLVKMPEKGGEGGEEKAMVNGTGKGRS